MTESIKEMTFENALNELESIVSKLERGEVTPEESIAIYERGAKLKSHCEGKLKDAQLKVEKIVLDKDGKVETVPFNA